MTEPPQQPASGAPLSYDAEHKLQGLARRLGQYLDKPRLEALLGIYLDQIQDLEDAAWQLATERFVDTAVGAQLDVLGEIVGQERLGLSDDNYRALVRARIRANKSDGKILDIYAVAFAAVGDPSWPIEYDPCYPAAFVLGFGQRILFDEGIVNSLIRDATAAGVRSVTVFTMSDLHQIRFGAAADFPEYDFLTGFASATTPGIGLGQPGRAMDETTT